MISDYPYIDDDYIVAVKESGLPTVPLKGQEEVSLLSRTALDFPEILEPCGRNPWEGLTLHRLDTPTSGLVIFARNERAFQEAMRLQDEGKFIKYYKAYYGNKASSDGFEEFPYDFKTGTVIRSAFRAYGVGRKAVRPVLNNRYRLKDASGFYDSRIEEVHDDYAVLSLRKGFRHQVRCHMAWSGRALIGDELYGAEPSGNFGLHAYRIRLGDILEVEI